MRLVKAIGVYLLAGFVVYLLIELVQPGLSYTASLAGIVGFVAAVWWYWRDKKKDRGSDSISGR